MNESEERVDAANPDAGVRALVRLLDVLEGYVAYEWLTRVPAFRGANLAYFYVLSWLALLSAILGTSDAWSGGSRWLVVPLVALPAYRAADIVRWWLDLLFDRRHFTVVSNERALLFAILNLIESALIGAIWLRASGCVSTAGTAMFDSFTLVTQLGLPPAPSVWSKVAVAATEGTALLLFLGGVASLIAEVQEKITPTGTWQGRPRGRS